MFTERQKRPSQRANAQWQITILKVRRIGAPDRIRTCDLCLRRAALYPAELRVLVARARAARRIEGSDTRSGDPGQSLSEILDKISAGLSGLDERRVICAPAGGSWGLEPGWLGRNWPDRVGRVAFDPGARGKMAAEVIGRRGLCVGRPGPEKTEPHDRDQPLPFACTCAGRPAEP